VTGPHNVLLDTSAVVDLRQLSGATVAAQVGCEIDDLRPGISSVTLAELTAGPHAAVDPSVRAARQALLQWVESTFDPLPFGNDAARAYGVIYAAVIATDRKPRKRLADLLIASVAAANKLPLVTRNPDDFVGLGAYVAVVSV
jgi:predicted nucleic acid-binding protein